MKIDNLTFNLDETVLHSLGFVLTDDDGSGNLTVGDHLDVQDGIPRPPGSKGKLVNAEDLKNWDSLLALLNTGHLQIKKSVENGESDGKVFLLCGNTKLEAVVRLTTASVIVPLEPIEINQASPIALRLLKGDFDGLKNETHFTDKNENVPTQEANKLKDKIIEATRLAFLYKEATSNLDQISAAFMVDMPVSSDKIIHVIEGRTALLVSLASYHED